MSCGIYKITNMVNGKIYIGSSKNIKHRIPEHLSCLRGGYHRNLHLMSSWAKYGESSFIFEVLLRCDKKNLLFYEDRAIEVYKVLDRDYGYNIRPAARVDLRGSNYEEMCEKLSINNPMSKKIVINGKEYSSRVEAAKSLGMNYQTFKNRLKRGISLDRPVTKSNKGRDSANAKPITVNGKYYNTRKEAAEDLGISNNVLCRKVKEGDYKNIVLKQPIIVNGKQYSTKKAAADALGLNYQTFVNRFKNGIDLNKSTSMKGKDHPLYGKRPSEETRKKMSKKCSRCDNPAAKAIVVDGVYYSLCKDAAKALGISPSTLSNRIRKNKPGYSWANKETK